MPHEQRTQDLYRCDPTVFAGRFRVVDRTTASFDAFVYLAVIVICIRRAMRS